jgi:threonine/homoserine/homoserine lactone efflux protein
VPKLQYISFFVAVLPSYQKAFPQVETTQYYIIGFLLLFPLSQMVGLYLLFHLVFYTIARRLDIMVSLLNRKQKSNDLAIIGSRMIKQNDWSTKYFLKI